MKFEQFGNNESSNQLHPAVRAEVDSKMPDTCSDCPVQCTLREKLAGMAMKKHMLSEIAEGFVGELGEEFDAVIDENTPEDLAELFKRGSRSGIASALDESDEAIDQLSQIAHTVSGACDGPLKMRASKSGSTYTVSVCTSDTVNDPSRLKIMPARIKKS